MKLGLMSDIHGNRIALDAVITDAAREGVDAWWVLGDLVAIGPEPVATLEVVANLPRVAVTRGNTERYVLTHDRPPPSEADVIARPELLPLFTEVTRSFAWTLGALCSSPWLDWLAELPLEVRAVLSDGTRLLGVHASPGRDDGDGITPDRPETELAADLGRAEADVVCAGHTHRATDRQIAATRAVNLGSVSNPITDDLRAGYVIIGHDRHGYRLEHRRVDYDHHEFLARLARSGHLAAEYIGSFQLGRQLRHPEHPHGVGA